MSKRLPPRLIRRPGRPVIKEKFSTGNRYVDVHGDDAARLIEALGDEPAFVLGSSGGGQIGLNLAARHPERVRVLVAHEPPCVNVLPDPSEELAGTQDVYDTYRRQGVGPALQKFMEFSGLGGGAQQGDASPQIEPPPQARQAFARMQANLDYLFAYGFMPISSYVPDVEALRAGPARIFVGIGESSRGQLANRTAVALADKLGAEPVTFPGGHDGFGSHSDTFAETLHRVFRGQ